MIKDLGHTFFHARHQLRLKIASAYPEQTSALYHDDEERFDDIVVLQLLHATNIRSRGEEQGARLEYERIAASYRDIPTYEEQFHRGWLRRIWGRVHMPIAVSQFLMRSPLPYASDLVEYSRWLWKNIVELPSDLPASIPLETIQALRDDKANFELHTSTPSWISARLWERNADRDLKQWQAKWSLLGSPTFELNSSLSAERASSFIAAVFAAIRTANMRKWTESEDDIDLPTDERLFDNQVVGGKDLFTIGLLGRYLASVNGFANRFGWDEANDLLKVLSLVLSSLASTDDGPTPKSETGVVAELALEYPRVLRLLCECAESDPLLLADMTLDPSMAILAAYLNTAWSKSYKQNSTLDFDPSAQAADVFESILIAISHFMQQEVPPIEEFSLLLIEVIRLRSQDITRDPLIRQRQASLERCVAKMPADTQAQILDFLLSETTSSRTGPAFLATLSILPNIVPAVVKRRSAKLAMAYRFITQPEQDIGQLSLISAAGAQRLVQAILETEKSPSVFLAKPFDVKRWRSRKIPVGNERYYLVRAQQRLVFLLSQAIEGYTDDVPVELTDAFMTALKIGALDHTEKGKVGIFGQSYIPKLQVPKIEIAENIARAASKIRDEKQREKVIEALLEVDDLRALATFRVTLPHQFQSKVEERIRQLGMADASGLWSYPEVHDTIRLLLNAELPDVADQILSGPFDWGRLKNLPGMSAEFFGLRLRTLLQQAKYQELLAANVPPDLPESEAPAAKNHLLFYKGLAMLEQPNQGSLDSAIRAFASLNQFTPSPAVSINLLVARRAKLTATDFCIELDSEEDKKTAQLALEQVDKSTKGIALPREFSDVLNINGVCQRSCRVISSCLL